MNLWAAAALALIALGCQSEAHEQTPPRSKAKAEATANMEWRCGDIHDPRPLVRKLAEPGRPFSFGVIADAKEPLPATLDNLKRFAAVFARDKVAAVLALGGLGANEDEIARVLEPLAAAHAPILALPGDREPEGAFHDAIARLQRDKVDVIDLAKVRAVDGGAFSLVSLPGYRWPHYLGAGSSGCRYSADDVKALAGLFDVLPDQPRILVAHTPPRGEGPDALDWALGGANVGDPALTELLSRVKVALGLFAHVDEAGGRATAPPGTWQARLWLNAGAADSVPHTLAGGGSSRGQAAVVEFSDGRARYTVVR